MSTATKILQLRIDTIRLDGGTQLRDGMDHETIEEFVENLKAGAVFPPVIVYFDGRHYWLADGFHRAESHRQAGRRCIDAEVRSGDQRAAILHAAGCNQKHGLRRTNQTKRNQVMVLLADAEWGQWTSTQIAKHCGVSEFLVRVLRQERKEAARAAAGASSIKSKIVTVPEQRIAERNGTTYRMTVPERQERVAPPAPSPTLTTCPACGHQWED